MSTLPMHCRAFMATTLLPMAFAACGPDRGATAGGQTVVRVNGHAISARQIEYALTRLPQGAALDDVAARAIAEQYVDQQLLMEKALRSGVHRDAEVAQALEESRRRILAEAYLERVVSHVAPPDRHDVHAYYRAHPELFAQRKMYELRKLLVDKALPLAELEAKIHDGTELPRLVTWLQAKRALRGDEHEVLPAERISPELLPTLHEMTPGERLIWTTRAQRMVVHLADVKPSPVSERQASDWIERYLLERKRQAVGEQLLKTLRQQARIEWGKDFTGVPAQAGLDAGRRQRGKQSSGGVAR